MPTNENKMEQGAVPTLSKTTQAKVFGGTLAPLLLLDLARGGGLSGAVLGVAVAAGATVMSPLVAPYVEEAKIALSSAINRKKTDDENDDWQGNDYDVPTVPLVSPSTMPSQRLVLEETVVETVNPAAIFPIYPDDETIQLAHVLKTGQRFDPHFDQFVGQGIIASAVQGSGKSQFTGRLVEQVGKCGAPCFVLDHKGEYWPVTKLSYIRGLRAGSEKLQEKAGPDVFVLTPKNVDEFVAKVQTERLVAIIELPSYGDSWLERARIAAEVGQALMRWSARQRDEGNVILPSFVVLDEAQLYLPQNINLLPPEAQQNRDVLNNLSNAYFSLVSNGRSNGYTMCFATQSLTYIAKWAIKSCQIRIFMRHAEKNDLDACEQIINPTVATRAEIEAFPKGVGVVFGLTNQPLVLKMDKKESEDLSDTPGIKALRTPAQTKQAQQPTLSTVKDTDDLVPAIKQSKTLDLDTILQLFDDGKIDDTDMVKLMKRLPDVKKDAEEEVYAESNNEDNASEEVYEERDTGTVIPFRKASGDDTRKPSMSNTGHMTAATNNMAKYKDPLRIWNTLEMQSVRNYAREADVPVKAAYKILDEMDKIGLIQLNRKK